MAYKAFPTFTTLEKRTMEHALEVLGKKRDFDDLLDIDPDRLPRRDGRGRRQEKAFTHTPDPLVRSWRSARQLMVATKPGDVVLAPDRHGLLGIFVLMQAALPPEKRREVWSLAADSVFLELRLIASAHAGLSDDHEYIIDWELVQYRYSDRVLATSGRAQDELSRIGVDAELLMPEKRDVPTPISDPLHHWWLPGAVSRRNQSGEVLRALCSFGEARASLSTEDAPDEIWNGDSWDALKHTREVLGDRVERMPKPVVSPDVVVIGDPYSPPDTLTADIVAGGVPVVVPSGSTSAQFWPEAPQWTNADDLTTTLVGRPGRRSSLFESPTHPARRRMPVVSRAERISAGVPVFRDVTYLDECLESLLGQELEPVEILVVDDGSASEDVDEALRTWERRDQRIRAIKTTHRGVCVARNVALEAMTGDSFVFVDSDDYLSPDHLAKCAHFLRSHDHCWAVATWTRFFGAYEGIEAKPPFDDRVGLRENPIVSTTVLVDMVVRDEGIRFEPDLAFLYCEDWHFWSQIVAAGGALGLVPEALAHHRVHPSSGGHMRTQLAHSLGRTRATQPLRG